jgi:hypothetical protein
MRIAAIAFLLASCGGGSAPSFAGSWAQSNLTLPGIRVEMTLLGSGTAVSGTGVQHGEAIRDRNFTVSGTAGAPGSQVVFNYLDGGSEDFAFSQSDENHLALANADRTLQFARKQ